MVEYRSIREEKERRADVSRRAAAGDPVAVEEEARRYDRKITAFSILAILLASVVLAGRIYVYVTLYLDPRAGIIVFFTVPISIAALVVVLLVIRKLSMLLQVLPKNSKARSITRKITYFAKIFCWIAAASIIGAPVVWLLLFFASK